MMENNNDNKPFNRNRNNQGIRKLSFKCYYFEKEFDNERNTGYII